MTPKRVMGAALPYAKVTLGLEVHPRVHEGGPRHARVGHPLLHARVSPPPRRSSITLEFTPAELAHLHAVVSSVTGPRTATLDPGIGGGSPPKPPGVPAPVGAPTRPVLPGTTTPGGGDTTDSMVRSVENARERAYVVMRSVEGVLRGPLTTDEITAVVANFRFAGDLGAAATSLADSVGNGTDANWVVPIRVYNYARHNTDPPPTDFGGLAFALFGSRLDWWRGPPVPGSISLPATGPDAVPAAITVDPSNGGPAIIVGPNIVAPEDRAAVILIQASVSAGNQAVPPSARVDPFAITRLIVRLWNLIDPTELLPLPEDDRFGTAGGPSAGTPAPPPTGDAMIRGGDIVWVPAVAAHDYTEDHGAAAQRLQEIADQARADQDLRNLVVRADWPTRANLGLHRYDIVTPQQTPTTTTTAATGGTPDLPGVADGTSATAGSTEGVHWADGIYYHSGSSRTGDREGFRGGWLDANGIPITDSDGELLPGWHWKRDADGNLVRDEEGRLVPGADDASTTSTSVGYEATEPADTDTSDGSSSTADGQDSHPDDASTDSQDDSPDTEASGGAPSEGDDEELDRPTAGGFLEWFALHHQADPERRRTQSGLGPGGPDPIAGGGTPQGWKPGRGIDGGGGQVDGTPMVPRGAADAPGTFGPQTPRGVGAITLPSWVVPSSGLPQRSPDPTAVGRFGSRPAAPASRAVAVRLLGKLADAVRRSRTG